MLCHILGADMLVLLCASGWTHTSCADNYVEFVGRSISELDPTLRDSLDTSRYKLNLENVRKTDGTSTGKGNSRCLGTKPPNSQVQGSTFYTRPGN